MLIPTLRPGVVVVLDNLSCHKAARVPEAIEVAGCELRFLPAYSPDRNPIEMAIGRLKRLLRSDGHRTVPTLIRLLDSATKRFGPTECGNYIRHCGYGTDDGTDDATVTPN